MARAPGAAKGARRTFHQELVLNRWMLRFFRGEGLPALKARLADPRHEEVDEDGQTGFFHELTRLLEADRISATDLRRYDLNIVGHWRAITRRRNAAEGQVLTMKYFQYLSLLFTEIYLDWYFHRRDALLTGLNGELARYRAEPGAEPFRDYIEADLAKIAFWSATGTGKTLLLHVNIRQYLGYFAARGGKATPDKIILLTPNEGLSRQHLDELSLSGFASHRLFDKHRAPDFPGTIEVIDINKLGEEMGDKTVAVDAFEGDNLVLVDEGHRGTGSAGGAWMARREALVGTGFAFEYSATFSQAVGKGLTVEKAEAEILKRKALREFETKALRTLSQPQLDRIALTTSERKQARTDAVRESYAKAILFDYSYKFFHADGYGKESLILNLADGGNEQDWALYFTACLLGFYQQLWLWETKRAEIADFNIERPLWVFVGNTVSREDSDVLTVLRFLGRFLTDDTRMTGWIADLIADRARLLDGKGRSLFEKRFTPLLGHDADEVYRDILRRMFNAGSRQRLKLVNLKGSKGELALRVGTAEPFGLISIGDDSGFLKAAEAGDEPFDVEADDFGTGLFHTINRPDSKLTVLIGSRKFTEGWSSWRVATMGLLNMGRGEGSQIIQLFGRGVRLKGRGLSLKRSLPHDRPKGPKGAHLDRLETLNIFGVRADYMATFKDYLIDEGITPSDEMIQLDFPTRANLPDTRLKTLRLRDGYRDDQARGFKRACSPCLFKVPTEFAGKIKTPHVTLDLYPRVEALSTLHQARDPAGEARHSGKLDRRATAMFDWDRVYLAVQEHKRLKGWSNLRLDRKRLIDFSTGADGWYTLYAPPAELALGGFGDVLRQQAILTRLLTDYTDRFYQGLKAAYEGQYYDVGVVDAQSGSLLRLYQFDFEDSDDGATYRAKLEALKAIVAAGEIGQASHWHAANMVAISFGQHLYYPLLAPESGKELPLKMRPIAFDAPSEVRFVKDLQAFYDSDAGKEAIGDRSLYLLRNADTRSRGLGFALAGNFYPDFLLWLVDDATGQQWLSFVDPKGLRNLDLSDPKLALHTTIKDIEKQLGDDTLTLSAFILSDTALSDLLNLGDRVTEADLEARNVLFLNSGREKYLTKLVAR